jgi:hypothetical protein
MHDQAIPDPGELLDQIHISLILLAVVVGALVLTTEHQQAIE